MRILVGVHQFPPFGSGGTEQLARWTALGLRSRGHAVCVVSAVPKRHARGDWQALRAPDADGLDVRFLEPARVEGSLSERIAREYDDPVAGSRFANEVVAFRPDVIHFFHLAGLTAAAATAARQRGVPYFFTASDFWYECPTVQLLLEDGSVCAGPRTDRMNCAAHLATIRWPRVASAGLGALLEAGLAGAARQPLRALQPRSRVLGETLGAAAAVVAPNEHMRTRLRAFGVDDERLRLMPYPVPDAPVSESRAPIVQGNGGMRALFIGTLAPSKGAHVLLEALCLADDADIELDVYGEAGDPTYASKLRQLAGTDRRIRFRGTFAGDAFARVVGEADLVVVPSIWNENSPLVLLQALALRCPVLVSDVPGLAPHVRGAQDGWTFERADPRDLARMLRRIAADPAGRAAIRKTPCRARTMASYMDNIEALYGERSSSP